MGLKRWSLVMGLLLAGRAGLDAQPPTTLPANTVEPSTPSASTQLKEITTLFLRGQELERQRALQPAAQAYREVISISPEYVAARYRLATVLRAVDPKSAEALDHLRFCVAKQPGHSGYRQELVSALSESGLTVNAIEQLEALRHLRPGDPRIAYQLAELYWSQQDGERAGRLLDELIERYPRQAGLMTLRTQIFLKQGEYQKALSLLDRALASDPASHAALMQRGRANVAIGDVTSAVRDLEMAARSNPVDPEGYRLLSQARQIQGDRAGAKQAQELADAVANIPDQQAKWLMSLYCKDRRTPAEEIQLGSSLAALGRKDLAAPLLERGLKQNPRDRAGWHLLGKIRYETGDYAGAVEAFKVSEPLMKRQNRVGYYQFMSTALFNAGNLPEAQQCVSEGLRSFPKDQTLLQVQAKLREARQPKKEPEMTSVERNRLIQQERKRRWLEEKQEKRRR